METKCPNGREHHNQRGEESSDASGVKCSKAKRSAFQLADDDTHNQKARDNEEHVYADKAPLNAPRHDVKGDHSSNRNSPQPVYIWTIGQTCLKHDNYPD